MAAQKDNDAVSQAPDAGAPSYTGKASWGPKLFWAIFALIMVFFWWLLIHSDGVVIHHG